MAFVFHVLLLVVSLLFPSARWQHGDGPDRWTATLTLPSGEITFRFPVALASGLETMQRRHTNPEREPARLREALRRVRRSLGGGGNLEHATRNIGDPAERYNRRLEETRWRRSITSKTSGM